ncbi:hypothetical protein VTK73DRAFT_2966 [Phialemonium thermophilum]|uniref:N-acetyltransferase domain-containing protein n=1 Tax=Phialemonium thermophilum TaxID=223376 RepID=A0ABR3X1F8_9PEZI
MRINENIAVSTSRVLLVPYDRRHVAKYHSWMEDPAIQEATASERLTLEEEYENQASWRASHDKLTFIVCQPVPSSDAGQPIRSGEFDGPDQMVGDVNFFLYPLDEGSEGDVHGGADADSGTAILPVVGEVDIMIASAEHRGKGLGRAAVATMLQYVMRNSPCILREYTLAGPDVSSGRAPRKAELRALMVKIKSDNAGSIALFRSLGFCQRGEVNYFGEVEMILSISNLDRVSVHVPQGYTEVEYIRTPKMT